jgi:hypothetical protein
MTTTTSRVEILSRSKISPTAGSEESQTSMAAAAVASTSRPRRAALGGAPHHFSARPLQARRPHLAVSAGADEAAAVRGGPERFYFNFTGFPFPLGPFLNRRTIRTEVTNRSRPSLVAFALPPCAGEKNPHFS